MMSEKHSLRLLVPFCFNTQHAKVGIDHLGDVIGNDIVARKVVLIRGDVLLIPRKGKAEALQKIAGEAVGLAQLDEQYAEVALMGVENSIIAECVAMITESQ